MRESCWRYRSERLFSIIYNKFWLIDFSSFDLAIIADKQYICRLVSAKARSELSVVRESTLAKSTKIRPQHSLNLSSLLGHAKL